MKLHLIRHPKPRIPAGWCYGQSDVPLQDEIGPHATRLRPLLPSPHTLYSSPLSRAARLAHALGAPRIDERLKEMNFGDWEQKPYENFPKGIKAWTKDPLGFRPPNGETGLEVAQRIWSFHQELLSRHRGEHIVVVGHSGPFRLWITQALGLPLSEQHVFQIDFARVTQLELLSHSGRLCAMNL